MDALTGRQGGPSAARPERVLLISMPFGAVERPSLALGLLQAHCTAAGVSCETQYLNLAFAERIGLPDYLWVCNDIPYTAFAGDWLFAAALYDTDGDDGFVDTVLRELWHQDQAEIDRLLRVRRSVRDFLLDCLEGIPWGDYTLVGFTSVFQQNIASLALAELVAGRYPEVTIAFGGANWEEEMGAALLDRFPFVDLAFSGEADQSFLEVLRARREGLPVSAIPGVIARGPDGPAQLVPAVTVRDLDTVPVPDYDPYFGQLRARPGVASVAPTLLAETSRGCWWGVKSHCTFCGLNGGTMAFRSKSPGRVVDELSALRDRYGVRVFSIVDDILDSRYFQTVIPELGLRHLGIEFFWEVKANLGRQHVRQLRDAGVIFIQPGIESLNDHVLKLMRKGTTATRNVELLKWCKEYGVTPLWNLLYGFPGETADDYRETAEIIQAIWHLNPPTGYGPVRLDRFSPYHADPLGFGMVNVRPMTPFRFLYNVDDAALMRIAYYFDYDHADCHADDAYARPAVDLAIGWMNDGARGALQITVADDGSLLIEDTRRGLVGTRRATLTGWKAAVYDACDRSQLFETLANLREVRESAVSADELQTFLDRCLSYQIMISSGGRYLSVAVYVPERAGEEPDRPLGAAPASERRQLTLIPGAPEHME
jgi:ribosomal peptide maturation radical SAM protein 1